MIYLFYCLMSIHLVTSIIFLIYFSVHIFFLIYKTKVLFIHMQSTFHYILCTKNKLHSFKKIIIKLKKKKKKEVISTMSIITNKFNHCIPFVGWSLYKYKYLWSMKVKTRIQVFRRKFYTHKYTNSNKYCKKKKL